MRKGSSDSAPDRSMILGGDNSKISVREIRVRVFNDVLCLFNSELSL